MSWIDKEIKRRTRQAEPTAEPPPPAPSGPERVKELWHRFEAVNGALPAELQLASSPDAPGHLPPDSPRFRVWLRAPDGAALGWASDAIRYVWTKNNPRKSNNFWIRWSEPRGRFVVQRRIGSSLPSVHQELPFDERRVERMVKCLVLGRQVKIRAIRRRRLWLF